MASWEDQAELENVVSCELSHLNIDAPPFIPGQTNFSDVPAPELPPQNQEVGDNCDYEVVSTDAKEPERKKKTKIVLPIEKFKETLNLVFIGHVDAGKSTIGGHLLYLTGMIDKRTLEKYEREAKDKNRESWYLSWALDTNIEEREKGKTVECGRGFFETERKHFNLIDAPGHKSFVPNMISGAATADLAILVISARRGEFETGFEKGGQTREHAMLVKTTGVKHLIVLINKMDDQTVQWDENRYHECREKLIPYLKKIGFNVKNDVYFMPCSGFTGAFLRDPAPESTCGWYRGPSLLMYLDNLPGFERKVDGPLRLPVAEKFKDMGVFIMGKLESGRVIRGQTACLYPNKVQVEIVQVFNDDVEIESATAGETVKLKLKNVEEEDISAGFLLCSMDDFCHVASIFDAHVVILEYKSIICAGFTAMLHIHCCSEEVRLRAIICKIDKRTGQKGDIRPRFIKQDDAAIVRFELLNGAICLETFKDFPQMGRFVLRDEGRTVGVGKVLKIIPSST